MDQPVFSGSERSALKFAVSPAQREFLLKEQFYRRKVTILRSMLLVLFLALWELGAQTGAINDFIFSSPSRIARCFLTMAEGGTIFFHIGITLFETLLSFLLVVFLGLLCSLLLWMSKSFSDVMEPYLVALNSLPKSALAPLLIVWLGNNMKTIIVAAVSVAVFGSIMTLFTSFRQTDPEKIKLIYSLGGKRKDVLSKVLLPSSVPIIISNMKVNIGLCLVGVIIGEFLAANAGLGYLIIYGQQTFRMDQVVMSIVILCLVSAVLYQGITLLEKKIQH
ncbi:ABC transporter permease [Clostridium sp. AM58-1XD]|uniref:ABC transporter permease n=1 Tax=Clostridium sp. AM58-1XD TaxID=2292307 RepID=UPI000E498A7F|nr:ABC transporter permease [Clostridium sp. AM58-1XD]RGZ01005.1 ABC transporter permease [Clostridium sp. AM58-1XD]